MNPLEDIIVALRPFKQSVPWPVPNSVRLLDVTKAAGAALLNEFTDIDPANNPAAVTNDMTNFGWEYVWHCHILGHEENDMMRAMVLAVPPAPPTLNAPTVARGAITLTWTNNAITQTGFTIQRAVNSPTPSWTSVGTVAPSTLTFRDTTVSRGTSYIYRVLANNVVGYTKVYAAPAIGYPHMSADSTSNVTTAVTAQ
jgi:hypothetical protein